MNCKCMPYSFICFLIQTIIFLIKTHRVGSFIIIYPSIKTCIIGVGDGVFLSLQLKDVVLAQLFFPLICK